jgi:hypothetical protein
MHDHRVNVVWGNAAKFDDVTPKHHDAPMGVK